MYKKSRHGVGFFYVLLYAVVAFSSNASPAITPPSLRVMTTVADRGAEPIKLYLELWFAGHVPSGCCTLTKIAL